MRFGCAKHSRAQVEFKYQGAQIDSAIIGRNFGIGDLSGLSETPLRAWTLGPSFFRLSKGRKRSHRIVRGQGSIQSAGDRTDILMLAFRFDYLSRFPET